MITFKVRSLSALVALFFATAGYAYVPQPDTVLNVPASAAQGSNSPNSYCYFSDSATVASPDPSKTCSLNFPLTIPTGHTIKQITVIHGTGYPLLPNPAIGANLYVQGNDAPNDNQTQFGWDENIPVPNDVLESSRLMSQLCSTYYDAFIVQPDTMYSVRLSFGNGEFVTGLQIIYN